MRTRSSIPLIKINLILVDKLLPNVTGTFGAVYQDFEKDIYEL